jgi:predicted PurR-regulated permease PerM
LSESPRKTEYLVTGLLIGGGVIIAYLCARIFQPFWSPVVWATVLALMLHPLYRPLAARVRSPSVAALLLCTLGALLLAIPFYWIASLLPAQIKEVYERVQQLAQAASTRESGGRLVELARRISDLTDRFGYYLPSELPGLLREAGSRVLSATPRLIGGAVQYLVEFIITLMTLFFFLRDGDRLIHWLRDLIPLEHVQTEELFTKVRETVRATVLGGLAVAAAQGSLGGLLFLVLGLPTPLLWGVVMGLLSIVPLIGAWLVWVPAGLVLLWQGEVWRAGILLGGGFFGVSLVDNVLRPVIIGQRTALPTLLVFFSVLGGVRVFGPVGLIVGPVLVSLLAGMLEFTRLRVQRHRKSLRESLPLDLGQTG